MNNLQRANEIKPDPEQDETTYHSYILRVWKSKDGSFKGYILDLITNQTHPLINIPPGDTEDASTIINKLKGAWIKSMGCWLGLWKPEDEEEQQE